MKTSQDFLICKSTRYSHFQACVTREIYVTFVGGGTPKCNNYMWISLLSILVKSLCYYFMSFNGQSHLMAEKSSIINLIFYYKYVGVENHLINLLTIYKIIKIELTCCRFLRHPSRDISKNSLEELLPNSLKGLRNLIQLEVFNSNFANSTFLFVTKF